MLVASLDIILFCNEKQKKLISLRRLVCACVFCNHGRQVFSRRGPIILKDNLKKLQTRYKNYQQVYGWVKRRLKGWLCCYLRQRLNHSNMQRIPDGSLIFTDEVKVDDLALDCIRSCDTNNKLIIFSDLLLVLKAMNHIIQVQRIQRLKNFSKNVKSF